MLCESAAFLMIRFYFFIIKRMLPFADIAFHQFGDAFGIR